MKSQTIKTNLFIITNENGNKFIKSYETIVAEIIGQEIICNGTYSKTTTAHINHVATIMNKKIVSNNERPEFNKLPYGIRIK